MSDQTTARTLTQAEIDKFFAEQAALLAERDRPEPVPAHRRPLPQERMQPDLEAALRKAVDIGRDLKPVEVLYLLAEIDRLRAERDRPTPTAKLCKYCNGSGEEGERDDYGDWRYRGKCGMCDGSGLASAPAAPPATLCPYCVSNGLMQYNGVWANTSAERVAKRCPICAGTGRGHAHERR